MKNVIALTSGLLTAALTVFSVNAVVADEAIMMEEEFYETSAIDRDGRFYVGGTIGKSKLDINNEDFNAVSAIDVVVTEDSDTSFDVFAGYHWNDYLAFEGFYADMGTAEVSTQPSTSPFPGTTFTAGELDYSAFGLSAVLKYPLFEKLSPYFKLGYSSYKAKGSDLGTRIDEDNSSGLHLGAGVEYAFSDNVAARLGYNSIDKDDAAYYGASLVYYFGSADTEVEEEFEEIVAVPTPSPAQKLFNLSKDIFFVTDKADLTPSSRLVLDNVITVLNEHPKVNIAISAFTDNRGSAAYNVGLSDRRAKSAASYLTSKGLPATRIVSAKGFGESRPIASNDTAEGRAKNRRVEIRVAQ